MTFVQARDPPTHAGATTSETQSGTATTAGNFLVASLFIRAASLSAPPAVTFTDNSGSNVWTQLEAHQSGSGHVSLFYCADAAATSTITATWAETATAAVLLPKIGSASGRERGCQ